MKVFFVVKNNFPNGLATTARVINYCKGMIENNIECEVIIPVAIERYEEPIKNVSYKGVYEGIPFFYVSKNPRRSKYLIYRKIKDIFDYIRTLYYLYLHVTSDDVVIVYEGGCFWFKLLAKVVHFKKAQIVMELNELPYGTSTETKKTIRKRAKMLNEVFPLYDGFFAISESLMNLARKYSPRAQIIKIPIIVDTTIVDNVEERIFSKPYLFHSGSLFEQKDGIVGMLEAFAIANKKLGYSLNYILTGYPNKSRDYQLIVSTIEKLGIQEFIHFTGFIQAEQLRIYQKNCLATIINKYPNQQNEYCFSTKLGEYLAFAKPVIITNVGEAMYYLNNQNSYIVDPYSSEQIAEKIVEIVQNKEQAQKIGAEGYGLAKNIFNCNYQGKRIADFLFQLKEKINHNF